MKIEVLYSCDKCGISDRPVKIEARTVEPLKDWMESLSELLSRDHDQHSPRCKITSITQVKIPIVGTDRVGGTPVN